MWLVGVCRIRMEWLGYFGNDLREIMKKKKRNKDTEKYRTWRKRVDYKNALKEWSKAVQRRDNDCCVICSTTQNVQSHHILERMYHRDFSLEVNVGISLCVRHHRWGKYSAHTNPIWFASWLQKHRPEQYEWCKLKGCIWD